MENFSASSFFCLDVTICLTASLDHSHARTFASLMLGEISALPLSVYFSIDLFESIDFVTVLY